MIISGHKDLNLTSVCSGWFNLKASSLISFNMFHSCSQEIDIPEEIGLWKREAIWKQRLLQRWKDNQQRYSLFCTSYRGQRLTGLLNSSWLLSLLTMRKKGRWGLCRLKIFSKKKRSKIDVANLSTYTHFHKSNMLALVTLKFCLGLFFYMTFRGLFQVVFF